MDSVKRTKGTNAMATQTLIRQRYTVSEIIATQAYVLFTFGSEGYAITNDDYSACVVSHPYYKFHKGNYQRCYGDTTGLEQALRIQKQQEWYC